MVVVARARTASCIIHGAMMVLLLWAWPVHADDDSFDEGFADTSQVTAERGEIEALTSSLNESLHDLDDALAKLDAGTYGQCERCGAAIGEARLEAMPAARLCIACASAKR